MMKVSRLLLSLLVCAVLVLPAHAKKFSVEMEFDFLPPPPTEDSIDFQRDKALYTSTRALRDTPRWQLARGDADMKNWESWFAESFGMTLSKEKTPHTQALLLDAMKAVKKSYKPTKDRYMRTRPYIYFKADGGTCFPEAEAELSSNGSYPSGHTIHGWTLALILAELSPERRNELLKRGYELGQSRVICGFHWQSDVDAGRLVASAAVNQLHNDPGFRKRLKKARQEIAQLRSESH